MDRRSEDKQLGYLTGKVEGLDEKLDNHMNNEEQKIEKLGRRIDSLETKMDKILEKTQTFKGMWLLFKFIVSALLFLVAFKFGDILTAWSTFKANI
jgi:hypothetical protein